MDALLKAAIRRRELEAEQLSLEGDSMARPLCAKCGKILASERMIWLRHAACGGKMPEAERKAFVEKLLEARRAQLARIAERVETMDLLYGVLTRERNQGIIEDE